jgi:hypothetical protein
MRNDEAVRLFAQCYGLALGLALGAFVCTVPVDWREAVADACWVGQAEAGQVGDRVCPALDTVAAGDLSSVAMAGPRPGGIEAMR